VLVKVGWRVPVWVVVAVEVTEGEIVMVCVIEGVGVAVDVRVVPLSS
jgi:hypothetical protein